jgi:hypothetical protein
MATDNQDPKLEVENIQQMNRKLIDQITANDEGEVKQASAAGTNMIRRRIREEGFSRRIIPPVPVTNDDLDRVVQQEHHIMKTLDPTFTFDEYHFNQLARKGDVALFEKKKPNGCFGYEVVVVQRHPAMTFEGRKYPAREAMPPSTAWGVSGWTYMTLGDARRKFKDLVAFAGKDQKQDAPAKRRTQLALA